VYTIIAHHPSMKVQHTVAMPTKVIILIRFFTLRQIIVMMVDAICFPGQYLNEINKCQDIPAGNL
jgi:hypothetical protein